MLSKIGIRPVIDGRQFGIRESLEVQTMNMAKAAAELISSKVRHASGEPMECVIADTTIGGIAESAACADKFATENIVATLTVTPCWCYVTQVIDENPNTIKAVWGFNGTERPGAVRYAIGCLMNCYLDDEFRGEYPQMAAHADNGEYYVSMMTAWYFATALAKQYDAAIPFIEQRRLRPETHRRTIQKAIESFRITDQQKQYLRTLR